MLHTCVQLESPLNCKNTLVFASCSTKDRVLNGYGYGAKVLPVLEVLVGNVNKLLYIHV